MSSRMLAQHQSRGRDSDGLRRHDFVGQRIFDHAVLMNPRFVCEGVFADDGFVGLHRHGRDVGQHLAGREQFFTDNGGRVRIAVRANSHCHYKFFQRGVPCALADAVDRTFHLPNARVDSGQRVGHRESQVVVAVG